MLVIGLRVSGLMLFAPFFGSAVIPPRIKVDSRDRDYSGSVSLIFLVYSLLPSYRVAFELAVAGKPVKRW